MISTLLFLPSIQITSVWASEAHPLTLSYLNYLLNRARDQFEFAHETSSSSRSFTSRNASSRASTYTCLFDRDQEQRWFSILYVTDGFRASSSCCKWCGFSAIKRIIKILLGFLISPHIPQIPSNSCQRGSQDSPTLLCRSSTCQGCIRIASTTNQIS